MKKGIATLALILATTVFAHASTSWTVTGGGGGVTAATVSDSGSWTSFTGGSLGSWVYGSIYNYDTQTAVCGGGGGGLPFTCGVGGGSWGSPVVADGNYVIWLRASDVQTCNGLSYSACATASASKAIYFTVTTFTPPTPQFFLTSASTTPLIAGAMSDFGIKVLIILGLVVTIGIAYLVFKFGWRKVRGTIR